MLYSPEGEQVGLLLLMKNLVIETKLAPPRYRGNLVQRETLLNRLSAGRGKLLTLVNGPAGFGKTTLVTLWRQDLIIKGHDVAWYSLNRGDDLGQFMIYLAAALDRAVSGMGAEALTLLNRDSDDAVDLFLANLLNDIGRHPREIYLVLDDFHVADSDDIQALVSRLLAMAPANLHLVLVTRARPRLDLARLRTHGQMTEIEFAELRLSFDEAAKFMTLQNVRLQNKEQRVVYELADGWIAGLQLLCIALRRDPDPGRLVTSRLSSITDFSDYLDSETLNYLGSDEIDFLVKVSACRKFNEDLGQHLTGNAHAGQILQRAVAENLFLIPLESTDKRQWYRFHPLMGSVLRKRLAAVPQNSLKELNQKACHWFIENELVHEAIRHAIYAEDYTLAAQMIGSCGRDLVNHGHIKTVLSWGEQIPPEIADAHPEMQLPIIWALLLCHRNDEAQAKIEQLRESTGERSASFTAELNLQTATLFFNADETEKMLQAVEPVEAVRDDPFIVGGVANILAVGLNHQGEFGKARDVQLGVRRIRGYDEHLLRCLIGECFIGQSFALQGDMPQAERSYREALAAAEQHEGFYSDPACIAIAFLSEVLYETGRWDEARKLVSERIDIIERVALPDGIARSYICLARIEWFRGHVGEARAHLETLEDIGLRYGLDRLVAGALREGIRFNLEEYQLTVADELMRRLDALAARYDLSPRRATSVIPVFALDARIRYQMSLRNWDETLEQINALLQVFEPWQRFQDVARLELLAAIVLDELGRKPEAIDKTQKSLLICQRLGLLRTVLDEGEKAYHLIKSVGDRSETDPMLSAYIQKLSWDVASARSRIEEKKATSLEPLEEELSIREAEILTLLGQSLTNKKIAISLGVTHETVKWHLKNIYGKFGVSSRDEAVARGRDLNLFN
jgi:LuxR family maltose regulon positive regulatory protein